MVNHLSCCNNHMYINMYVCMYVYIYILSHDDLFEADVLFFFFKWTRPGPGQTWCIFFMCAFALSLYHVWINIYEWLWMSRRKNIVTHSKQTLKCKYHLSIVHSSAWSCNHASKKNESWGFIGGKHPVWRGPSSTGVYIPSKMSQYLGGAKFPVPHAITGQGICVRNPSKCAKRIKKQ